MGKERSIFHSMILDVNEVMQDTSIEKSGATIEIELRKIQEIDTKLEHLKHSESEVSARLR